MWGNFPGPIEPIILLVGGGSFAGIAQFVYLKRQDTNAGKFLAYWVTGLVLSLIPTWLTFVFLGRALSISVSWPAEVALSGLLIGGFAALVSGCVLRETLQEFREERIG